MMFTSVHNNFYQSSLIVLHHFGCAFAFLGNLDLFIFYCRGILSLAWCPEDSDLLMSCGKVKKNYWFVS